MPRSIKLVFLIGVLVLLTLPVASILLTPNLQITNFKVLFNAMFGASRTAPPAAEIQSRLNTPAGYDLNVYARDVPNARFMHVTRTGDLLVSQPRKGRITLLQADKNNDGVSDAQRVLLRDLVRPHGIDIYAGWLYIAESIAIGRIRFNAADGTTSGDYERIVTDWSDNGNHWSKTLHVGPDGWLYVTAGSTCNVCEEADPHRAVMLRISLDGQQTEIYASGLRNAVGFDWAPWNDELYATDNGRDLLGDELPADELDLIQRGAFYGWPYAYGQNIPDPDFGEGRELQAKTAIAPLFEFKAHTAPLGITFLRHQDDLQRTALVALHGSWNRSTPAGYKVVALHWSDNSVISASNFVSGFENKGQIIGRPVDVAENPQGEIFISDDYAGLIYRVSRSQTKAATSSEIKPASAAHADTEVLDAAFVSVGRSLYRKTGCISCHGVRPGERAGVAKPLENLARFSQSELIDILTTPTPPMPRFELGRNAKTALAQYMLAEAAAQ